MLLPFSLRNGSAGTTINAFLFLVFGWVCFPLKTKWSGSDKVHHGSCCQVRSDPSKRLYGISGQRADILHDLCLSRGKAGPSQGPADGEETIEVFCYSLESLGVLHRAPTSEGVLRAFLWACSACGSGDAFQWVQQSLLPLHRDLDLTCVRFHLLSTFPFQELDQVALEFTLWLVT